MRKACSSGEGEVGSIKHELELGVCATGRDIERVAQSAWRRAVGNFLVDGGAVDGAMSVVITRCFDSAGLSKNNTRTTLAAPISFLSIVSL